MELKDREGFSALHLAIIHKRADVVERLLRLGADPLARCPDIHPSYGRWRLDRSLRAMQALLQVGGPGPNLHQVCWVFSGPTLL